MVNCKTQQSGEFIQAPTSDAMFHLGLGQPSPRLLPMQIVAQSSKTYLASADPLLLQYNRAQGATSVRQRIAELLTAHRTRAVDHESLVMSNGNSQALDWVASTLSTPGDLIFCEDPTYFLASKIFDNAGLRVHPIPVQADGIDLDTLEHALATGLSPKWLYCIPAHHNPTGVSLSSTKMVKLLELAKRHGFFVVFDDPYAQLHFNDRSHCALDHLELSPDEHWLRLGSFSKIFAPGLRLGWIEASTEMQSRLLAKGMLKSGGGLNPLAGAVVSQAIASGALQSHRDLVRNALKERANCVRDAVQKHLPDCKLWPLEGGYFGWLEWPTGFNARAFSRHCKANGVHFLAGELTCVGQTPHWTHAGRISLSFYEAEELQEAIERIAKSYAEFVS